MIIAAKVSARESAKCVCVSVREGGVCLFVWVQLADTA